MTIYDFLKWLATAGGAAALFSFVAERIDAWQALESKTKSLATLGGTIAIALASYAILTYVPKEILDALAPWFLIAAGCVTTWIASQGAHAIDPARIKSARDQ